MASCRRMPEAVRLRGATKRYGAFTALDDVDLDIHRGEVFALLGPNGAGKTTLISLVAGTSLASEGTVEVLGRDVVRDYRFTRRAVGPGAPGDQLRPLLHRGGDPPLPGRLLRRAGSATRGWTRSSATSASAKSAHANTRALSGGMKRRLLIAKALVHDPPVLFLDEPTAGVDVELRRDLWTYVKRLASAGTTVVLTTHYLEEAEELADRIGRDQERPAAGGRGQARAACAPFPADRPPGTGPSGAGAAALVAQAGARSPKAAARWC